MVGAGVGAVGFLVGVDVGLAVGAPVGRVGATVGAFVGAVGVDVGTEVGRLVGMAFCLSSAVHPPTQVYSSSFEGITLVSTHTTYLPKLQNFDDFWNCNATF